MYSFVMSVVTWGRWSTMMAYKNLERVSSKGGKEILHDIWRKNEIKERKYKLSVMKIFLTARCSRLWNSIPSKVGDTPFLKTYKTLEKILYGTIVHWQRDWMI